MVETDVLDIQEQIEKMKLAAAKQAAEANRKIEKMLADLKEAKMNSMREAVRKAGAQFEDVTFKPYIETKNRVAKNTAQINKIREELNKDMQYLNEQYKIVRDALVLEGAKEDWLTEFIGEPPEKKAEKKTATTGTSTGDRAKRTKPKAPDGTMYTWVELARRDGIPDSELEGNSAKRVYLAKKGKLPEGYTEVEV